jgi:sugar lactone lactonase YvrE
MPQHVEMSAITASTDKLGETPIWHAGERTLYWVEVRDGLVRRLKAGETEVEQVALGATVGSLGLRRKGGLVVSVGTSVVGLDFERGTTEVLASVDYPLDTMRFNDGACDRQGRFWVGSMDNASRGPVGTLYRLAGDGLTPMIHGICVPNSLCWSLDSRTMFFADGIEPVIWAHEFEPTSGSLGARREFARLPAGTGVPDGATIDAEGFLWSAIYGGNRVHRYAPDGALVRVIDVPVRQPTCCALGGDGRATLFVTTALQHLTAQERHDQPLAGAVLSLPAGVSGLPEPAFAW